MTKESADAIAVWADIGTLIVLGLTVVALFVTARQLRLGRRAATASAVIALNESFRQAWLVFTRAADEDARQHTFADIMNLLETTCALFEDGLFVGKTGKLIEDYLCHIFTMIQDSEDSRSRIKTMFNTPKTFEHCLNFIRKHRGQLGKLYLPPEHTSASR